MTATVDPGPPAPVAPVLRLEPPEVTPPRFEELWRELLAEERTAHSNEQRAPEHLGTVVTVFSPKGGTGTTTVATNMALLLAARGRHSACLVDLDLAFGDVSIMTGLSPARSLVDAVGGVFNETTVDAVVTGWQDRVDCVLAPVDPSAAERIRSPLVAALLSALQRRYDYVVVDTPSQLTEHVLDALDAGDHHVLVTTPSLPALKSTRLLLDTLQLLGYPESRRCVVLNQASGRALDRDGVQQAIAHPVTAVLPASVDVAAAIDAGTPLALRRPDHAVVKSLAALTRSITGEPAPRRGVRLPGRHRRPGS